MKWPQVTLKIWDFFGFNERNSTIINEFLVGIVAFTTMLFSLYAIFHASVLFYAFSLLVIVIAFLLFLVVMYRSQIAKSLSERDKNLLKEISNIISRRDLDFIKNHDFKASFNRENIHFLNTICSLKGDVEYEFLDRKLNSEFQNLIQKARKCGGLLSILVRPSDGNPYLFTTSLRHSSGFSDEAEARNLRKIKDLNDLATEFAEQIEKFYRIAREKFPELKLSNNQSTTLEE